jgi:hypothetical protein
MDKLHEFYLDKHMQEAVKEALLQELDRTILSKVYSEDDVSGANMAKQSIEGGFKRINDTFTKEKQKDKNQSI